MYDGTITVKANIDTKEYDKQIEHLVSEIQDLEYELQNADRFKLTSKEVEEYSAKLEKAKNKLGDLVKKKQDLNVGGLNGFNESIEKTSNKISKVIGKMGKWALAVFSIRSAYNLVRQSVSTLTQYDSQLSSDIQYMQYALATGLAPIIKGIVNAMYYLLGLVNAISIAMFNYDLLSEASAKNFKKASGSAKEIKKTLAGFDEINILSDTSSSGGVSGFSMEEAKKSEEALKEYSKKGQSYLGELKTSFTDMEQTINKPGLWNQAYGEWGMFVNGAVRFVLSLKEIFVGIWNTIVGLVDMLVGLFAGDTEKITEGWKKFCDGLWELLKGLFDIIVGALEMMIGIVIGLLVDLVKWIWNGVCVPIGNFFSGIWESIASGASKAWSGIKSAFANVVAFFTNIKIKIANIFHEIGTKVGDSVGGAFKSVINAVLRSVETLLNKPINTINTLIKKVNSVAGMNIGKLNTLSLPRLAVGGVINMPGKGVNYGGANIGERGAEGVIPLTNTEMMAQLGEAIGKYITINASITNTMNGRVISRELQKVNNSNDFAFNR